MGNAINPGSQRAPGIEFFKTAPQLKMNLLQQIAATVSISFVGVSKPFKCRAIFRGYLLVKLV
jgi:hypothetical protein